jgi:RNA polymerase sigma factor (TIGR02999 family)
VVDPVTTLLGRWAKGDRSALDAVMPVIYDELKKIARAYAGRESPGHTLQPTALVHEAWMRLAGRDHLSFSHRHQFYALAAKIMRGILVDHARAAQSVKRGGEAIKVPLTESLGGRGADPVEVIALDDALTSLAAMDERQARAVELKYFGGLTIDEMAEVLAVSAATISRDLKAAEAWLGHALADRA